MSKLSQPDFYVRPEVAELYEISFILCGLLFCRHCNASLLEHASAGIYSDLAYYQTAEFAYEQGWRPIAEHEYAVVCPACGAHGRNA